MNILEEAMTAYTDQNYTKAHELFYPLATKERNSQAQFHLGMIYFYGEGVEKNIDEAMQWWKKAMRNGNVDAAYRLSEISTSTKTTF
jgi:hypothetical protein